MTIPLLLPDADQPIGYPVSVKKLAIMHVMTFGYYDFYWAYKNLANLPHPADSKLGNVVMSFFLAFTFLGLLSRVKQMSAQLGHPIYLRHILLSIALAIICLSPMFLGNLKSAWLTLLQTLLVGAPLCFAQVKINALNRAVRPDLAINGDFSVTNIVAMAIGAIFWVWTLVGLVQQKGS